MPRCSRSRTISPNGDLAQRASPAQCNATLQVAMQGGSRWPPSHRCPGSRWYVSCTSRPAMRLWGSVRRLVFGPPKDVEEPHAFHKLSLIAFLAWVGLGADGLSSSAYGPEETFRQLGEHRGLAVFLALAMIGTVLIISYGYSRIIEQFPSGGGGYLVASKILGAPAGLAA